MTDFFHINIQMVFTFPHRVVIRTADVCHVRMGNEKFATVRRICSEVGTSTPTTAKLVACEGWGGSNMCCVCCPACFSRCDPRTQPQNRTRYSPCSFFPQHHLLVYIPDRIFKSTSETKKWRILSASIFPNTVCNHNDT